ncbi:MAG TPA: dihydropteroate synthase [Candidatus Baltobacteraceae bacterium]|jgi:dihydropteroate synthase|nr:dihydropteroate synthase [Candidatus Baltobacteraceae bacterium]
MLLRARQFEIAFPRPALLMGVVNATPDSFYDGGRHGDTESAVAHALKLAGEGADIIDIGGESSRPRAGPVSQEEELRRVIPVLEALAGAVSIPLSIDTVKPGVAREALRAGASIINDIAANRDDAEMWRLAAESGAAYVVVHMQGTPATMQENPVYDDVVREVNEFFEERLNRLRACGVNAEQVVLDVGIGFGKAPRHNLQLLAHMARFTKWERPLLLGASRKSFMGRVAGAKLEERLPPSLACACWGVQNGARIIRCHDVAATRHAVRMTEALMNQQTNA